MSKNNAPTRLAEIAPASGDLTPMEDIKERDLLLVSAEPCETQFGEGYLLTLAQPDGSEPFQTLTSGVVVVKQLKKALADDPFASFIVRFEKSGRAWTIV